MSVEEQKTKQWYVVHAFSGHEGSVMREITARAGHYNLTELIGEVVVPAEEVVEMKEAKERDAP